MMQILETASYGISLAYASRNRFPFSTYGENFFLTIQNVIITLLIIFFSSPGGAQPSGLGSTNRPISLAQKGNLKGAVSGFALTVVGALALWSNKLCPPSIRKF
jgi:mannose-P-dolichol utilization defect protein 1